MTKLTSILCAGLTLLPLLVARANIYATDPKLNGSSGNLSTSQGNPTAIGYILNEPANLGVTINILSGTNVIRTLTALSNQPGTAIGTNVVYWDGYDSNTNLLPLGTYTVTITAASAGHAAWTQISRDSQPGTYVWDPQGIAVDNNSNSPYYGRVFVGNAQNGPHSTHAPLVIGDTNAILKFNADGSYADDGAYGTGGYPIVDDGSSDSPQKLRMGNDDRLYMNDLFYGQVAAFDPALKGNQVVLTQNNYANNPYVGIIQSFDNPTPGQYGWFGMDVDGAASTTGYIWLGDADTNGAGVWFWHLTNGMADPNDMTGTQAISVGSALTVAASGGLMVDTNLDIFVAQDVTDPGDTNSVCMEFTNATPDLSIPSFNSTNGTFWMAGGTNNAFLNVYDTTIDSRRNPRHVALAHSGPTATGVRVLNPTNGATMALLDTTNGYFVTAWDNVGNLYAASGTTNRWRVFSPPDGTNQATTPVHEIINIVKTPTILGVSALGTNTIITFTGSYSNALSSYILLSSPVVEGPYTTNTSVTITTNANPGFYSATVGQNGATEFYQIIH
jgi:hypothetical protein